VLGDYRFSNLPTRAPTDAVIARTLEREAMAAEQARRSKWRKVTEHVAKITSSLPK
jgi:hypothetical protein